MITIEFLERFPFSINMMAQEVADLFLNLAMQLEAIEQADAKPYQRSDSRKAHRNGCQDGSLKTRVADLTLKKPQFLEISFERKVFDIYIRARRKP